MAFTIVTYIYVDYTKEKQIRYLSTVYRTEKCVFDDDDVKSIYRICPIKRTVCLVFLAHLSRRLVGELIVYGGIRRPSVRRRPS